jgi:ATP synthase protein I
LNQAYRAYATYGTVGMQLVLCLVVGLFGGQWLDQKAGTTPVLTMLGTLLGLVAGFRSLYVAAKQAEKELSAPPDEPDPGPRVFGPVPWETAESDDTSHREDDDDADGDEPRSDA